MEVCVAFKSCSWSKPSIWPVKGHSRTHKRWVVSGESNIKLSIFKGGVDGSSSQQTMAEQENKQLRSPEKKKEYKVNSASRANPVSSVKQLSKTSTSKLSQSTTQSNINIDQYWQVNSMLLCCCNIYNNLTCKGIKHIKVSASMHACINIQSMHDVHGHF